MVKSFYFLFFYFSLTKRSEETRAKPQANHRQPPTKKRPLADDQQRRTQPPTKNTTGTHRNKRTDRTTDTTKNTPTGSHIGVIWRIFCRSKRTGENGSLPPPKPQANQHKNNRLFFARFFITKRNNNHD